jgi:hypothetical protein
VAAVVSSLGSGDLLASSSSSRRNPTEACAWSSWWRACLAGHFDIEHSTFQLERPEHRDHEGATHP